MVVKRYYVGGMGPYLYDNSIDLLDPEGEFPGDTQHALVTDGQLIVEELPTQDNHIARQIDIKNLEYKLESEAYFFARSY